MYDEEPYQYQYQQPKSPLPAAILASFVTTIIVFFALRLLDEHGVFGRRDGDAVEVPSVLGMHPDQARELLKARDLLLSLSGEREDPKYAAGSIAVQSPLPGSQAPRGTSVQALVSRGLTQVQIPNFGGLRPEDALRQLAAAGLQAGQPKSVASATVPAGMVVGTDPPAGASVAPQTVVSLVLSAKPVPKVTGLRMPRARKLLEDAGFTVGKIRWGSDDDRMGGIILHQEPAEGTGAPPGSPVDLTVNED